MKMRLFVLLILILASRNKSFGQNKSTLAADQKTFLNLARTLYTWSDDQPKGREEIGDIEEEKIVEKMRGIIQRHVIQAIGRGDKDAGIVDQIRPFQSISLAPDSSNSPFAKCFALNGAPYCLAAYTILREGNGVPDSHCYIDVFSSRERSDPISIDVADFRGHEFFVREVPAMLSGQEWILAWGAVLGDTGSRLSVRLYSFDGERIKTIWSRDGLTNGDLEIFDGFVRLEYDPYYRPQLPERKIEHLFFTPNGLQ